MSLRIQKRDGDVVSFNPTKIQNRIKKASKNLNVNSDQIFIKVITSVPTEGVISTKQLDKLIYEIAASYTGSHHDYSRLASSVAISSYHKETNESFSETMKSLADLGIVNQELINMIEKEHNDTFYNVFLHSVADVERNNSGASEFEIYFNYILKYHKDNIKIRPLLWKNNNKVEHQSNYDYISCHWYMR